MSFRYQHGDRPLEGYTVLRGVGRGGFGEVYYAVSDGGREVALKSILFNQEIELRGVRHCINLKSPHLVAIFDVRVGEDGVPFVIMEYVTGPSLRDIIREHPDGLGKQKAAYLLREMAKGLAYLHERGIVHRDLKPENIFYEEGFVKIGDYGLSKFISASHQSGQTMSVGTVHYMAPEIGSGNYHRGIDVYALGVILYEMLTGEVPFKGDSFGEILMKHLTAPPDLAPIEPPFRAAVEGALAKKPEERFPSVDVMAKQLFESGSLNSSLSIFNPATLSQAARRAPVGAGAEVAAQGNGGRVSSLAETTPVPPPRAPAATPPPPAAPPPAAPPPPGAEQSAAVAAGKEARPLSYREAGEKLKRSIEERAHRNRHGVDSEPRRRLDPTPVEAIPLDPLDSTQRVVRTLFVAILSVIAMRVFPTGVEGGRELVGFLACAGGGALGVLLTEFKLAQWFQVRKAFGWQLVAVAAAALPVIYGAEAFASRRGEEIFFAILLSMVLVDWQARLKPLRDDRISLSCGFTGGLCGLILGGIFAGEGFFVGGVVAAISLMVNGYAPFVPVEVRRRWRRHAGESDEEDEDGEAPGAGAVPAPARPRHEASSIPPPPPAPLSAGHPAPGEPRAAGVVGAAAPPAAAPARAGRPAFGTRFFWLFIAAACIAGGLSSLIAAVVVDFHPEEILLCIASGLSLCGYSGFSIYRGLWATRPSFWGRTLRPFLLVTTFNATAVATACFALAPAVGAWRFGGEETVVSIAVLLSSAFLFGVLLVADQVLPRLSASPLARQLPRHQRPVHPFLRLVYVCLAAAAGIVALVMLSVGAVAQPLHPLDRFGFFAGSIGFGLLGFFFLRQALRRQRGHLWSGAVRPFLLTAAAAALCICALPLVFDLRLRGEEVMIFVVLACFAAAFGVFVFFLRGPDETPENPLFDRLRSLVSLRQDKIASSWLGLGTLLWILGVGLGLASVLVGTGLSAQLPLHWGERTSEVVGFLGRDGAWLAFLMLLAGSASVVLGRYGSGVLHMGRGIIGQVALLVCLFLLSAAASRLNISRGLVVHADLPRDELLAFVICGLLSGAFGALLLAWPPPKARAAPHPEPLAKEAP